MIGANRGNAPPLPTKRTIAPRGVRCAVAATTSTKAGPARVGAKREGRYVESLCDDGGQLCAEIQIISYSYI